MKYKVGDIVKLRDDLEVNKFYGNTKLNEAMVNVIGKKAEIKEIVKNKNKDEYYAKFASRYGGNWFISDEMIERLWEECKSTEQVSKSEDCSVNSSVKKLKLIDVLNKIANGELKEGTKVITKDGEEFTYKRSDIDEEYHELLNEDCESLFSNYYIDLITDEVELIEPQEPTDNSKIEELIDWHLLIDGTSEEELIEMLWNKLNEVIRKLNKED